MSEQSKESRIILAIQALKKDSNLGIRAAAKNYSVPYTTLHDRFHGRLSRSDTVPKLRKLTKLEEAVIVQRILNLCSRAFPPRLFTVEDMANEILRSRGASLVGKNWASEFVKRQPELRTRFHRKRDYQRVKCEDPEVVRAWFRLVQNTIIKYGIDNNDIYNFDETGFMMGIISGGMVVTGIDKRTRPTLAQPGNREWTTVIQGVNSQGWAIPPYIIMAGKKHQSVWYEDSILPKTWKIALSDNGWTNNLLGLDWIKHFDQHSSVRTVGLYRLLILDGHASHQTAEFESFCEEKKIIPLCMPPHSSHILQPLDVSCFGPLKNAYGRQIENLVRKEINHITKLDFLPAFLEAFNLAITEKNIRSGFRATGLVPYDPESVVSKLDVQPRTSTPEPIISPRHLVPQLRLPYSLTILNPRLQNM